jgi:hypothetical protein
MGFSRGSIGITDQLWRLADLSISAFVARRV